MKRILYSLLVLLLMNSYSYADSIVVSDDYKKAFDEFYTKIDRAYGSEKKIQYLKDFEIQLNTKLSSTKLLQKQKEYFQSLYTLNHEKILELQTETKKPTVVLQKQKEISFLYSLKKLGESKVSHPDYIEKLIKAGKKIYIVNAMNEFVEENKIKKFTFEQFYPVKSEYVQQLLSKDGVILKSGSSYMFVENYTISKKIPFSSLFSPTSGMKFFTYDKRYLLDNKDYVSYNFETYNIFDDEYGFYEGIFGVDSKSSIFFQDEIGRFGFLKDYTKFKLVSANLLQGVTNKDEFLRNILDDKRFFQDDTDKSLTSIKTLTLGLIKNATTDEQKIEKIYSWILHNITYTNNFSLDDYRIYSGILTYENKDGVCDGYTKLMGYMLLYSGISDVNIIKGFVIDVQDFPQIGHAWVKIGNYYYDPTFDDPIGAKNTLTSEKYRYFRLPKDLFYTNRYDFEDTPEYLKNYSLELRKKEVVKNLSLLVSKYSGKGYLLLAPLEFRTKYKLSSSQELTYDILKKILPYYEVGNDYSIVIAGKKKYISSFQYYNISQEKDLENIFTTRNYDTQGLYVFSIKSSSGKSEYKVAYDVKFD